MCEQGVACVKAYFAVVRCACMCACARACLVGVGASGGLGAEAVEDRGDGVHILRRDAGAGEEVEQDL